MLNIDLQLFNDTGHIRVQPSVNRISLGDTPANISLTCTCHNPITITVTYKLGSRTESVTVPGYLLSPTCDIQLDRTWLQQMKNTSSAGLAITVTGTDAAGETYQGKTTISVTVDETAVPKVNGVTPNPLFFIDGKWSTLSASTFVQGRSRIRILVLAETFEGSEIAQFKLGGCDVESISKINDTSWSIITNTLCTEAGNKQISITAIDNRGKSSAVFTKTIIVAPYHVPYIKNATIHWSNSQGVDNGTRTHVHVGGQLQYEPCMNGSIASNRCTVELQQKYAGQWQTVINGTDIADINFIVEASKLLGSAPFMMRLVVTDRYAEKPTIYQWELLSNSNIINIANNKVQVNQPAEFNGITTFKQNTSFSGRVEAEMLEARQAMFFNPITVANGGTGATTANDARRNIGAAAADHIHPPDESTLNNMYPVGSIYLTVDALFDPSHFFGGTWVQWGQGRMPISVNTADADFNSAEKTGGAKTVALSTSHLPVHKHTINNSTSHTHAPGGLANYFMAIDNQKAGRYGLQRLALVNGGYSTFSSNTQGQGGDDSGLIYRGATTASGVHTHDSANVGSGTAHSNMPPYITCYMWKRTS